MNRANIYARRKGGALTTRCTTLTANHQSIITGFLLGDGCVTQNGNNRTPRLSLTSTEPEYAQAMMAALPFEWTPPQITPAQSMLIKSQTCQCKESWRVHSLADNCLRVYHDEWYSTGKKIVPADVALTPEAVLHWFLGDGSSTWQGRPGKQHTLLSFATHGFTKAECEMLCDKLKEADSRMTFQIHRQRAYWVVETNKYSAVSAFYEYIGACPYPCFEYKWKHPLRHTRKVLSAADVVRAAEMRLTGMTFKLIAQRFGVSLRTVWNAVNHQRGYALQS